MKLIKRILREELLKEYEIYPIDRTSQIDGGLISFFNIEEHSFAIVLKTFIDPFRGDARTMEISFGPVDNQKVDYQPRTNYGLRTANSIIYTIFNHVEPLIKKFRVERVTFRGARDDKDKWKGGNSRSKFYYRFIKNKYPEEALSFDGDGVVIDMKQIFTNLFDKKEEGSLSGLEALMEDIKMRYDLQYNMNSEYQVSMVAANKKGNLAARITYDPRNMEFEFLFKMMPQNILKKDQYKNLAEIKQTLEKLLRVISGESQIMS